MDRLPGPRVVRSTLGVIVLVGAGRLATLPITVASWRWRQRYGLTDQSLLGLGRDVAVSFVVTVVVLSGLVAVLLGLARALPRAWPAVAGVTLAALTLGVSFLYPVVVEPLFNHFQPLPAGELRSEVLALADREGVPVREVLVADASRRTTTLNAYVSGFGSSRRVVLYDTLVDSLPRDQVLAVTAHELTHARNRDVWWGSLLGAAGVLVAVGLLGLLVGSAPISVPRLLAWITIASLLATPVQSAISRRIEWRADVGALTAGADPQAVVELQHNLSTRALADPAPPRLSFLIFGTHPLAVERIALARRYAEHHQK